MQKPWEKCTDTVITNLKKKKPRWEKLGERTRLKSIHKLNDENDSLRDAHLNYIGKTLNGLTGVASKLTKEDTSILWKYGAWMDALLKKEIQPFTEAQKIFIENLKITRIF